MILLALAAIVVSGSALCALTGGREAIGRCFPAAFLAGAGLWSMAYATTLFTVGPGARVMIAKDAVLVVAGGGAVHA